MMPAKLATLDFAKIKLLGNENFDSHDSNYIAGVVMWPKFGNSGISMREVVITSVWQGFDHKDHFLKIGALGWSLKIWEWH